MALQPVVWAGDTAHALTIHGRRRTYLLHHPADRPALRSLPLVLVLHGGMGTARGIQRVSGMNAAADREEFLVAYPQGSSWRGWGRGTWNAGGCCGYAMHTQVDDVAFLRAVIDDIEQRDHADPARVYVTGISNGGMMAYRMACEAAERISAIAPIAGAMHGPTCAPTQPVSVAIFHGTDDQHVLYDGGPSPVAHRERVDPSVSSAVAFWVAHNRCASQVDVARRGAVEQETYHGCADGADVALYRLMGQGHAWPGGRRGWWLGDRPSRALSATDALWDFFRRHRRPAKDSS